MKSNADPKAFVLISNDNIYYAVKTELENCGYKVEGLLSAISNCALIVLDHAAFQLDIVSYLREKSIEKPILLILTETQTYSVPIQSHRIVQDILVVREPELFESGIVISALEGEGSLQTFLMRYLPTVPAPALESQKPAVYARISRTA